MVQDMPLVYSRDYTTGCVLLSAAEKMPTIFHAVLSYSQKDQVLSAAALTTSSRAVYEVFLIIWSWSILLQIIYYCVVCAYLCRITVLLTYDWSVSQSCLITTATAGESHSHTGCKWPAPQPCCWHCPHSMCSRIYHGGHKHTHTPI